MAITHKISSGDNLSADGKTIYVKDLTGNVGDITYTQDVNNPGTYTSSTNSTGYGSPNKVRSDFALYLVAYIKTTTKNRFLTVKTTSVDPLIVDTFEVTRAEDGWYNYSLIRVDAIASPVATSYAEDALVYDKTTKKLLKKSGTGFVEVTDLTSYLGSTYVVATSEKPNIIVNSNTKISLNVQITNALFDEHCNIRIVRGLQERYDRVRGILESANYQYGIGNKLVFQKLIEYLNDNVLGE